MTTTNFMLSVVLPFVGSYAGRAFYEWRQRRKAYKSTRGILSRELRKGR